MLFLALRQGKGPVLLKDVARGENISEKYLSQIVIPLKAGGLLVSVRGARGGYMLNKAPSEIVVKDIIEALDGKLRFLEGINNGIFESDVAKCLNGFVWGELEETMNKTLSGITLADLIRKHKETDKNTLIYNI